MVSSQVVKAGRLNNHACTMHDCWLYANIHLFMYPFYPRAFSNPISIYFNCQQIIDLNKGTVILVSHTPQDDDKMTLPAPRSTSPQVFSPPPPMA